MQKEVEGMDALTQEEFERFLSFFIMPGAALFELRKELSAVTNQRMVSAIMFRFGFRCGTETIRKMEIDQVPVEELNEVLPDIWAEVGLARLEILESSADEILIEFKEPVEAYTKERLPEPACDFTRGYLSGVIKEMTDRPYGCVEERCVSVGDPTCRHRLSAKGVD